MPVYLRLAIGIPELASSLEKLQDFQAFVALWHTIHLPAAEILAPAFAAAELFGALLLLAGWQTRTVAALFVAELLSEILLTKQPLVRLAGWMLEWQSLCVVLILARIGAGPWSLDWRSARRRGARLSGIANIRRLGDMIQRATTTHGGEGGAERLPAALRTTARPRSLVRLRAQSG